MAQIKSQSMWSQVVHALGSLKLAVTLIVTLAAVIAVATILEADHGRVYAQWYVYHSQWFMVLLALLGINILCAALSRFPWKRHHTGFVITHAGLLVLLAGSVQSFVGGIEGQVTLTEGETAAKLIIPQQSQLTATWQGQPEEAPYYFTFAAGPTTWSESTTLDLGTVDDIRVRVLRYFSHASAKEDWLVDEAGIGGPVVRFKIEGPHNSFNEEQLLVDQDFGDEIFVGPIRMQLRRAQSQAMLNDFLKPPTENLGKKGLLLVYYQDRVKHISVDEYVGKKVPLDDSGIAVEIVEYMASAKPEANYRFRSVGDEPRNPLLELKVHEPGKKTLRQLAFAKSPLVNLDPIHGQACPVKCHYLHPAVKSETAIEFLQTDDGQLYCRTFADNKLLPKGKVEAGTRISMPGNFVFALVEHMPHARQKIVFEPQPASVNQKEPSEAAAEIELTAAGVTQTLWLQRNNPVYGARTMVTPKGSLMVSFGFGEAPIGFSLKLVEFRNAVNPGGVGNASFSSVVRLVDEKQGIDEERVISMNEPLTHKQLTFYQSGFNEAGHGTKTSTFSIGHDPGRGLKYGGSLLICLGIATMFYMRAYFFKRAAPPKDAEALGQTAGASVDAQLVSSKPQEMWVESSRPAEKAEELVAERTSAS